MTAALWLDAGVGLGALLALLLILNGARHLRRRRLMRGSLNGLGGLVFGCLAAIALLIGTNLLTYARFTYEQPVAIVSFRMLSPQRYAVTLTRHDGDVVHTTLAGDEWELDARIIKWKGIATVLGFKPLYRLERLSGRYTTIHDALTRPPSAMELAREPGLDFWTLAHREALWLPFVDASYGTATYLPMGDGATYAVSLDATGLLARPANAAAIRAVRGWE
jgi:hypothetical protein